MCPSSVHACRSFPREDDPSADAGPERQRPEVGGAPAGAVRMLGVRRAARVVLHPDREIEPLPHRFEEIDLAQGDVDGTERVTRAVVEA